MNGLANEKGKKKKLRTLKNENLVEQTKKKNEFG